LDLQNLKDSEEKWLKNTLRKTIRKTLPENQEVEKLGSNHRASQRKRKRRFKEQDMGNDGS
jgi:hypothetical protein